MGFYEYEIYLDKRVFMDDMSWVDDEEFWRKIYEIAEQKITESVFASQKAGFNLELTLDNE